MDTKTFKVNDETHARFKAACALRGISMQDGAREAMERMMKVWGEVDEERMARMKAINCENDDMGEGG